MTHAPDINTYIARMGERGASSTVVTEIVREYQGDVGTHLRDLIGEGAARENAAVGETPNLAARLQQIAQPNAVVVAETLDQARDAAEAIELEVGPNSPAIGKTLRDLKLPRSVIIGGVQRGGEAFVPRGETEIQKGDHLIAVALPDGISAAEKLSG